MLGHFHEDIEHLFLINLTFLSGNHLNQILMLQIFMVVSFLVKVLEHLGGYLVWDFLGAEIGDDLASIYLLGGSVFYRFDDGASTEAQVALNFKLIVNKHFSSLNKIKNTI